MASAQGNFSNHLSQSHRTRFDCIIVFGQGPVKPVLLPHELNPDQQQKWKEYKSGTSKRKEPNFYVIDDPSYLEKLSQIDTKPGFSLEEKNLLKETLRLEWQKIGQFATKRWGRENALAAGLALYSGMTKEIILTGGKTKSGWTKNNIPASRLQAWPSEAELMADVIKRTFEKLYFEKYHRSIDEVIKLENEASNTLQNFSLCLNKYALLLTEDKKIGLLTARHHLNRVAYLAKLFSLKGARDGEVCAQELLRMFSSELNDRGHEKVLRDPEAEDIDAEQIIQREGRWVRAMEDPNYVSYWCGYVAEVKYPVVVQKIIYKLQDPLWFEAIEQLLNQFGLRASEFQDVDLDYLYQHDPQKYHLFVNTLQKCKSPEYRKMPPANTV